jgi:hypothetical protein
MLFIDLFMFWPISHLVSLIWRQGAPVLRLLLCGFLISCALLCLCSLTRLFMRHSKRPTHYQDLKE